jgi:hypothetical protein
MFTTNNDNFFPVDVWLSPRKVVGFVVMRSTEWGMLSVHGLWKALHEEGCMGLVP